MLITSSPKRLTDRGGLAGAAAPSFLERWTSLVLRFRWLVLAGWAAAAAIGVAAAVALPGHTANSFAVPGTESERAASQLAAGFGERPEGSFTVVFRVRSSYDRRVQARLRGRLREAARVLPGGRLGTFRFGGGVVYGELQSKLSLQDAKRYTVPLRRALAGSPRALVSGQPAVAHDLDPQLASDLRRGGLVALAAALVVLACVLGVSAALAIPFLFAAGTIGATLVLLDGVARMTPLSPYATSVVELIGLGLAIDYSLLVVSRYREELGRGRTDAIVAAMATAGRAVVFSGLAVAVGLALLLFVPVPFVRTLGLGALLIPLVSVAGALTLQPALLSVLGRPGTPLAGRLPWAALSRTIMRRPVAVLIPATALLLLAAAPALGLRLTPGSLAALPSATESAQGLATLRGGFGPGALTPTEVVVDAGAPGAARRPAVHAAVERLADRLVDDPEAYVVALGSSAPYVSPDGRYARLLLVGRHEFGEPPSQKLVTRLRAAHVPAARFPAGTHVAVGGAAPQGVDFLARAYGALPPLVLAALLLTYALLAYAFRSLLLPLKAIVLNVLTVAASYGLLVFATQHGVLVQRSGQVEAWIPIVLFAVLFGLSMDYEVFLVSRMREAWDRGAGNMDAVAAGLERTGGLITAAALVMAASFAGFVAGSVPGLQQFGLGLALAVLIDATIVRVLLVPSFMAVMGRWNWWLPRRAEQLVKVEAAS